MKFLIGLFYSVSGIFLWLGFDKTLRYQNPEYYGDKINVYVGGDAYNYIINSNYAIAYFILAVGCAIIATLFFVVYNLQKNFEYMKENHFAVSKDLKLEKENDNNEA